MLWPPPPNCVNAAMETSGRFGIVRVARSVQARRDVLVRLLVVDLVELLNAAEL